MTTIDRLREMMKKATPGDWRSYQCDLFGAIFGGAPDNVVAARADGPGCPNWVNDRDFIVAMRKHFAALLDVAEAAEIVREHHQDEGWPWEVLDEALKRLGACGE